MKSSDKPHDMFGADNLTPEQLEEYKQKLVWATGHAAKAAARKKDLAAAYNSVQKHYRKVADCLAEAIKFKNLQPLFALGSTWKDQVAEVRALYSKVDEQDERRVFEEGEVD